MNFVLHIIIVACISLFPVLGFNVVFGKGKILHFGQEALSLTAVYFIWVSIVQMHLPYAVGIIGGFFAVLCVGGLLAWLSYRLEPDGFGVMSIAMHLAALAVILNWQPVTRGALGIPKIPRAPFPISMEGFALVAFIAAAVWVLFLWWLDRSKYGRELAALSEHEWHAQALGVHLKRTHLIAFSIAALGSFFSAIFYPPFIHLLSPSDYQFPAMIFFVMCVLAGGPGRLWGVVASTIFLVFLKEGLRFVGLPPGVLGPVQLMLFGLILFAAVWWRRETIFPYQRSV